MQDFHRVMCLNNKRKGRQSLNDLEHFHLQPIAVIQADMKGLMTTGLVGIELQYGGIGCVEEVIRSQLKCLKKRQLVWPFQMRNEDDLLKNMTTCDEAWVHRFMAELTA